MRKSILMHCKTGFMIKTIIKNIFSFFSFWVPQFGVIGQSATCNKTANRDV